ncbi:hypothetical protein VKT23_008151 [Stygiomarasmius scandens]|uniref:Uncharacterized protein n=1 Tax=Marasmiellus scandens TaxID=2682957 RepID=A0ABR1JKN6_9AGAR
MEGMDVTDVANIATDHVQQDPPQEEPNEEEDMSAQLVTKTELTSDLNWADEVEQNEEQKGMGTNQLMSLHQWEGETPLQFQCCQIYENSALRQLTGIYQHPNAPSTRQCNSEDMEADDKKGKLDQLVPPTVTVR